MVAFLVSSGVLCTEGPPLGAYRLHPVGFPTACVLLIRCRPEKAVQIRVFAADGRSSTPDRRVDRGPVCIQWRSPSPRDQAEAAKLLVRGVRERSVANRGLDFEHPAMKGCGSAVGCTTGGRQRGAILRTSREYPQPAALCLPQIREQTVAIATAVSKGCRQVVSSAHYRPAKQT